MTPRCVRRIARIASQSSSGLAMLTDKVRGNQTSCRCTLFRRCSMTHPTTKSHLSRSCIPHTSSCSLNARLRLHVGTDDASAAGTTKRLTTILLFLEQVFLQYCLLWGNLSHGAACKARGTSWFQIQQTLFFIF